MYDVLGDWIAAAAAAAGPSSSSSSSSDGSKVTFSALSKVGERWDNGEWGKLDAVWKRVFVPRYT
eukprot:COSAG06_NODE_91_length_24730_cov_26.482603_20_plen_65_part_00